MEKKDRTWPASAAVAVAGAMLLPSLWPSPVLRWVAAGLAAVGIGGLVFWAVGRLRRRDRYDLNSLREVHEREAVQRLLDEEEPFKADSVLCRCCGAVYAAELGVCPECGRVAGG